MSLLNKIGSFFSGITSIPSDIVKLAEAAWDGIQVVWHVLTQGAHILFGAWDWVVHGVEWFAGQVGSWAGWVFGNIWQLISHTIPGAIEWVFGQAVHWAGIVVNRLWSWTKTALHLLERAILTAVHLLVNAVKAALHAFVHFATAAIKWVYAKGAWIWNLLSHPGNLAKWIAGAIIEPVVLWFLRAGATVIVWVLRKIVHESSEFAHLIERTLHDLM